MKRQRDQRWPELLAAFAKRKAHEPFAWGTNDCATFAAEWVEWATGVRLLEPGWTDAASAARRIEEAGGLEAAVTAVLGEPWDHPQRAQRGDVALIDLDGRPTLGVVIGPHVIGPGTDEMMAAPRELIRVAWRV